MGNSLPGRIGTLLLFLLGCSDQGSVPSLHICLTVDSLFGIIRRGGTDSLVVTSHETYGYQETQDINPQLHPVDGGVLYIHSNLQIP
jgi:hypothetical protein